MMMISNKNRKNSFVSHCHNHNKINNTASERIEQSMRSIFMQRSRKYDRKEQIMKAAKLNFNENGGYYNE